MQEKKKFCFIAAQTSQAQEAFNLLTQHYAQNTIQESDVIIALGGDGFLLKTVHENINSHKPFYGMNLGGIGFLMNEFYVENLEQRIHQSISGSIIPLQMQAMTTEGEQFSALAINEVALWRQSCQSAKIKININGRTMLEELSGDGIMVATPAGSTAYNLSAHGPILPLEAPLLALTPVSPFRPARWRGALISCHSEIKFEILEHTKRPVNAAADHTEIKSVQTVLIKRAKEVCVTLLFDQNHSWNERILTEQFRY